MTPDELTRLAVFGRWTGALLGLVVFAAPGLLGILIEGPEPHGLPVALAFLGAIVLLCAMAGGVLTPWGAKREEATFRQEVDSWLTRVEGERLEAACPARLAGAEPKAGVLIVTSSRVVFLAIRGSERSLGLLGARDSVGVVEKPPPARGALQRALHSAFAFGDRSVQLTGQGERYLLNLGVRHDRFVSWIKERAAPADLEVDAPPADVEWVPLAREERARSNARLVARPLRCALARGALAGLLSVMFVHGPLTPVLFGVLVAAVAFAEYGGVTRSRPVRYLLAVGAWTLSLSALFALAGHEAARTAGALGTQEAYAVALNEVRALLSASGLSEGLVTSFLCGIGLGLGLQTTWRLRVPLAGLVLIGAAAAVTPLVVMPEFWFLVPLALGIGVQFGLMLIFFAVFVEVTDAWLLGRRELERPPGWLELFVDAILRRKSVGDVDDSGAPALE